VRMGPGGWVSMRGGSVRVRRGLRRGDHRSRRDPRVRRWGRRSQ
jgi:hypothetical protein